MKVKLEWGKQNKDTAGNVLRNIEYINKKSKHNQIEVEN